MRKPVPVDSSNLEAIGYSARKNVLCVEFKSGLFYMYEPVPEHVHKELLEVASKGKYFNANIKHDYSCTKVFDFAEFLDYVGENFKDIDWTQVFSEPGFCIL